MDVTIVVIQHRHNHTIRANNELSWDNNLPVDLTQFGKLTFGGSIIMSQPTFKSISYQQLSGRENIVISRTATGTKGVMTAASLESALQLARYPIFILGDDQNIFYEALPLASTVYVVGISVSFSGMDWVFSALTKNWYEAERKYLPANNTVNGYGYGFDLIVYKNRTKEISKAQKSN